jgi:ABC-2 type transport system permease protein
VNRIAALLGKELADLRRNPGVFAPAALTGLVALALPFVVAVVIPYLAGERLADSADIEIAREVYRNRPDARSLEPEAAVQAWVFEQFLVLLVIAPVAASMSVAAFSVVGEKLARTLEPLLATPITTFELIAAKVLSSLAPAVMLTGVMFALYISGIAVAARPGVARMLLDLQSLAVVFLLAPLAALAALQLTVCASSRANDVRSAQQVGALVILPISALLVLQLMGAVELTLATVAVIAAVLIVVNAGLMWMAVIVFGRESILTRWT